MFKIIHIKKKEKEVEREEEERKDTASGINPLRRSIINTTKYE